MSDGRRDASGMGKPWGAPIISDKGQPVMGDAVSDSLIHDLECNHKATQYEVSIYGRARDEIDRLRAELAAVRQNREAFQADMVGANSRLHEEVISLRAELAATKAERLGTDKPTNLTEAIKAIREAGGKAWDNIPDPEAYLNPPDEESSPANRESAAYTEPPRPAAIVQTSDGHAHAFERKADALRYYSTLPAHPQGQRHCYMGWQTDRWTWHARAAEGEAT